MRALTVIPSREGSAAVTDLAEPVAADDELLVEGVAVGICGTDREIAEGRYGWAPPGEERLVLGHESLGRVRTAPPGSGFSPGDLVAGVVRRPDPVPCGACARGEFDTCRNGRYTERGIRHLHGYASEWWTVPTGYALRLEPALGELGVLLEPASVVAKAWEQIERVGARAWFEPRRVLVTGAGPIGLLAALLGVQRGLEVHVLDLPEHGRKPAAVAALGARYHHQGPEDAIARARPEIIIEATGAPAVVIAALSGTRPYGVVCLTGVSPAGRRVSVDVGAANREIVLENDAIVGSVNANLRHYRAAAAALASADRDWLARLVTHRVPLERAVEMLEASSDRDGIKAVVTLTGR